MDYLYDKLDCTYSLTVEVFGGPSTGAQPGDCFAYFNPRTEASLAETTREWSRMTIEAMYYVVREKKGAEYPYDLEEWMRPTAVRPTPASERHQKPLTPAPSVFNRNVYHPWAEWEATLHGASAYRLLPVSSAPIPHPSWNDACTPFFDALPQPLVERAVHSEQAVRVYAQTVGSSQTVAQPGASQTEPFHSPQPSATSSLAASPEHLRVLILGGAVWNDLLSPEIVCSWMTAFQTASHTAEEKVQFFFAPSLQSYARATFVEVPALHAGFCSAVLSSDSRLRLLTAQLVAGERLLHLMQDEIRPHVVIEVAAEEYVWSEQQLQDQARQQSFMHIEATVLVESETSEIERLVASIAAHSAATSTPASSPNRISSTVLSRSSALTSASSSSSSSSRGRCQIGVVPVERMILPREKDQPGQCPTCLAYVKVYAHGAHGGQGANPVEAAEAQLEISAAHEYAQRGELDRKQPDYYKVSEGPEEGIAVASHADAAHPTITRSLRMFSSPSDHHRSQSSAHHSAGCDFTWRNLPANRQEKLLEMHVDEAQTVWNGLVAALEGWKNAAAIAALSSTPVGAPEKVRFVYIPLEGAGTHPPLAVDDFWRDNLSPASEGWGLLEWYLLGVVVLITVVAVIIWRRGKNRRSLYSAVPAFQH